MRNQFQKGEIFDHESAIDCTIGGEADTHLLRELQQALAIAEQAQGGTEQLSAFAGLVLAWRGKIDAIFGYDGFAATPAWDIMLGLYRAETTGLCLTLGDVADLSPCEPPTVARWVSALEEMQLVTRVKPATGSPEALISLAGEGRHKTEMALSLRL